MSGLEALGAIASISQLCIYIHRSLCWIQVTIKDAKELPEQIRKKSQYLYSLSSIIDLVSQNPSLQTHGIEPHLQNIKEDIASLETLLSKSLRLLKGQALKRLWRIFLEFSNTKKEIARSFSTLEQNKSNLHLYIVNNFGSKFHEYISMNNPYRQNPQGSTVARTTPGPSPSRQAQNSKTRGSSSGNPSLARTAVTTTSSSCQQHAQNSAVNVAVLAQAVNGEPEHNNGSTSKEGKRVWSNIKVVQKESEVIYGDKGRSKGDLPTGEREWKKTDVHAEKGSAIFGDVYAEWTFLLLWDMVLLVSRWLFLIFVLAGGVIRRVDSVRVVRQAVKLFASCVYSASLDIATHSFIALLCLLWGISLGRCGSSVFLETRSIIK